MTDEEYTSRFLELLRYVPYLREEKAKVHRFISGFPVAYRYRIEFNEPRSLEVAIRKLKHCYEKSKQKFELKHDLKRNDKAKGKRQSNVRKEVHAEYWLVQLVTSTKKRVGHRTKVDFFDKAIECVDDSGERGPCKERRILHQYPVLQQFQDVFHKDISDFPPHREVYFSIELVPGAGPTLKEPYTMSTPNLVELKLQLKEMLDKGYIKPSVSP
eukprot:PITA_22554